LTAFTTTKPKESPRGIQFDVATSGGEDNSAFSTFPMPPTNVTTDSKITANTKGRILFSFQNEERGQATFSKS
jgi:hypothetical protein